MKFENVIVFDSETVNGFDDPLMYDAGWSVVNLATGKILKTQSFVIEEVFEDEELIKNAFFIDKMPQYTMDILNGKRILATIAEVKREFRRDADAFNAVAITAHNAYFDYNAVTTTVRYFSNSRVKYFFPKGVEIWDSLKMARQTFGKNEAYKAFCEANNFMVKGKARMTAEVLYRYISNNVDFIESHTGLEDTLIEKEILLACLKMDNSIEKKLFKD